MPTRPLVDRLQAGEVLLLDGATGSQLHRRGMNVSQGATPDMLGVWSAAANLDAPDLVRQVHADYPQLGVDVIISNNFWTSRPRLAMIRRADQWETDTRVGGGLAPRAGQPSRHGAWRRRVRLAGGSELQ